MEFCDHNPSKHRNPWRKFFDFLLHGKRLYTRETNTGICSKCGKRIELPEIYYCEMPAYSVAIMAFTLAVDIKLREVLTQRFALPGILSFLIEAMVTCVMISSYVRIYSAVVLSQSIWGALPDGIREDEMHDTYKERVHQFSKLLGRCFLLGAALYLVLCNLI